MLLVCVYLFSLGCFVGGWFCRVMVCFVFVVGCCEWFCYFIWLCLLFGLIGLFVCGLYSGVIGCCVCVACLGYWFLLFKLGVGGYTWLVVSFARVCFFDLRWLMVISVLRCVCLVICLLGIGLLIGCLLCVWLVFPLDGCCIDYDNICCYIYFMFVRLLWWILELLYFI